MKYSTMMMMMVVRDTKTILEMIRKRKVTTVMENHESLRIHFKYLSELSRQTGGGRRVNNKC